MSEAELQALCDEWQARLRLSDWRVKTEFAPYHKVNEGSGAQVEMNVQRRAAQVKVLRPEDEPPDGDHSLDTEGYLVHELLHLHFIHYSPEGVENDVFEQALNAIAAALVNAKRETL